VFFVNDYDFIYAMVGLCHLYCFVVNVSNVIEKCKPQYPSYMINSVVIRMELKLIKFHQTYFCLSR